MPRDDLESRFAQALLEGALLAREEPVAVAVSGGPDSVAMLHLFRGLIGQDGWAPAPHVIHLNHQLRGPDAEEDARFVRELARTLAVPCTIETVDVAERARTDGVSVESAGRACRFEFYERFCLKQGIRAVALAHHADDAAETILHRIIRGTGLRGLAGIRPVRPLREGGEIRVIRPMLAFRRREIEQYLRDRELSFRDDRSNESDRFTRNRLRNEILPLLRERFNPQVSEALIRLGEQAKGLDAYLSETCERMLESMIVEHDDRQLVLHAPTLTRKARVIQTLLARQAILRMGVAEGELTYGHLNAVVDLAAGQEGTRTLDLPGGMRVSRRYSRLVFERAADDHAVASAASEVRVATEGSTPLPFCGMEITSAIVPADGATVAGHLSRSRNARRKTSWEEWLDADRVCPPLIGRSRRPGDRFFPLGMTGMKKLSDFLIDEKVDVAERERTVVLCDQLGPIWIVPLRIDQRVRLTQATRRVLRLVARPLRDPSP